MSTVLILLAAAVVGGAYWLDTGDNSFRLEALKRLAIGAVFFVFMFLVGFLFGLYIVALWLLDAGFQLLFGREGLVSSGGKSMRLHEWRDNNLRWVAHGEGSPQLIP